MKIPSCTDRITAASHCPKLTTAGRWRSVAIAIAVALVAGVLGVNPAAAADQYFAGDGSAWSASKWGTSAAGPFTSAFTAGNVANFATVNGTGTGASITVGGIVATESFTLTSVSGTLGNQANGIITINVASGKTLDLSTQGFTTSAAAGYIKDGAGVLALTGGTFGGGFTLNAGAIVARGINAMGGNATPAALVINGGIIAGSATRDFSSKYSGITVGGNFQLGALTADIASSASAANLTFTAAMNLGAATRTITIGGTGIYTLGGIISGGSGTGLIVTSLPGANGSLTLNKANTFTGDVVVSNATVVATGGTGFGGVFGTAGTITITNGTVNNSSGNNGPFGNPGGSGTEGTPATLKPGNVVLQSGGVLTIGSGITAHIPRVVVFVGGELGGTGTPLTTFGSWSLEQGALVTNTTATAIISAPGVVLNQQGGTVIDVASGAANGIDLDVTGYFFHPTSLNDNGLIKKGAGLMRLQGTNTYTGNTVISNGTVRLAGSGSISNSAQILISSAGRLDVSTLSNPFALASGKLLGGVGVVTGNVVVASGGRLSPGFGAGSLSFSNNLTLNGTTTNLFELSNDPVAGANDQVVVGGNLVLSGVNTIAISYTSLASGRYKLFQYAGTLTGDTNNLTLTGFAASGRQTAYLDTSVPNEIALVVGGAGANLTWVGDGSQNNWDANVTQDWFNAGTAGADYFFNGDLVAFGDAGSKSPAVNLVGTLQPAVLLVTNNSGTYTFAGTGKISGTLGLTKQNAGTLVIANSGVNDFTGKSTIAGGTVSISSDTALGAVPASPVNDQLTLDGGTLQTTTGFVLSANRGLTLGASGGTLEVVGVSNSFGGPISGSGNLTKTGTGTMNITAAGNPYVGKTIIAGGTLSMNGITRLGATPGDIVLDQITIDNGAQLLYTAAAVSSSPVQRGFRIGNNGGIMACNTSGTLAIDGPLTGSGNLTNAGNTASVGTIELDNPTNTFSGDIYTLSGFFRLDDDGQFGTGTLHWYGGGLTANNDRSATANFIANPIDMGGDFLLRANSGNTVSPRNIVFSSGTINGTAGTLTINNVSGNSGHIFAAWFNGAGFDFPRPVVLTSGAANFTYLTLGNSNSTVQTFSGNISGGGRIRRTAVAAGDAGTSILTGNNTYTGGTEVDAGTLLVNNVTGSGTGSGTVTVTNTGVLGGNGAVGPTIVAQGGLVAPGNSVGSLAVSNLTLGANGAYSCEVIDAQGSAGTGWDALNVYGGVDVLATSGNPFQLKLLSLAGNGAGGGVTNFDNNSSYNWTLASTGDSVTNFNANKFVVDALGFSNDLAGGVFVVENSPLRVRFTNNHAPAVLLHTVTRTAGATVKIKIADLKAATWSDPDGDDTSLVAVDGSSTNGTGNVTQSGGYIFYTPGAGGNVTDRFNYTVRDLRASYRAGDTVRTTTGTVEVQMASATTTGTITSLQVGQPGFGTNTISFAGIPGYQYEVQFSTNLMDWVNLSTNTAAANGSWSVIDDTATDPIRFYRVLSR